MFLLRKHRIKTLISVYYLLLALRRRSVTSTICQSMKNYLLIVSCLLCFISYTFAQNTSDKKEILEVLNKQTEYWNSGKLEKFMEGYWKSDSLKFIGKNGITYGWSNTLANYQKRYPDKESRGTLKFEIISVDVVSKDAAFVIGKFFLTRPLKGNANGHFSLLWRKINGQWFIVADHSS